MDRLTVIDHPLVQNKIARLRSVETSVKEFRELVEEIAMLICYEATRDIELSDASVETPLCKADVKVIADKKFAIVPVLRAGLGMVEGMLTLIPTAKVGHIGLYRDHDTLLPVEYYSKLPADIAECEVFLLDPMLATGGTASAAVQFLKDNGVGKIKLLSLLAAPEGVNKVTGDHPDLQIYVAAYDKCLNEQGYIMPGLGDAGDRLYGTK